MGPLWDGTTHGQGNGGREAVSKEGANPPQGDKRQFLTSMDPEVIRQIKQAAIGLDKTASQVMETSRQGVARAESRAGKTVTDSMGGFGYLQR